MIVRLVRTVERWIRRNRLPFATKWKDNPYDAEWAERDYLHTPDGPAEHPKHPCKRTYLQSKPFIRNYRTAVDIGCRVGEFTRYLQLDFQRVFAFDPNLWVSFRFNVDLTKVTHFNCALGDERGEISMFGGCHSPLGRGKPKTVPVYTLDEFDLQEVDYIKVDVEGFEKKVLIGGAKTIERWNPLIVIEQNDVVLDGECRYAAKQYLEGIGYREVAVDRRGWDLVMVRD